MTARTLSALLFGAAVLIGCGPTLQVKTDFDHAAKFARYRSFQMGEGRVIEKGTVSDNTIVKDRVDAAIRAGLATRGLVQNADHADLIARFAVGARTVRELEGVGYPLAVGVWGAYPEDFWVTDPGGVQHGGQQFAEPGVLHRARIGDGRPRLHPEGGQPGFRAVSAGVTGRCSPNFPSGTQANRRGVLARDAHHGDRLG